MSTETTSLDPMTTRDPGSARDRILDESLALFSVRGFADVSMSEIAAAVGITKAALYYHFTGKEELFATAFANEIAMVRDQIATIVTSSDDLPTVVRALAIFFLERGDRDMRRLHQDFMSFVSPEKRDEFFRDVPPEEVLAETLDGFFRHRIREGAIRDDIDIIALIPNIFGMAHAQFRLEQRRSAADAPPRGNDALAASIVDTLLYGIVPR